MQIYRVTRPVLEGYQRIFLSFFFQMTPHKDEYLNDWRDYFYNIILFLNECTEWVVKFIWYVSSITSEQIEIWLGFSIFPLSISWSIFPSWFRAYDRGKDIEILGIKVYSLKYNVIMEIQACKILKKPCLVAHSSCSHENNIVRSTWVHKSLMQR